jgi:hypothetical protein
MSGSASGPLGVSMIGSERRLAQWPNKCSKLIHESLEKPPRNDFAVAAAWIAMKNDN